MTEPHTNGPWIVRTRRTAYENPWVRMEHNDVTRPDGAPGIYGVVRFANLAIGVLPLFDDATVPLVGQHRFPFNAYSWELPEGGGPRDEDPADVARRELAEETGVTATYLVEFGRCHLSNSVTDEEARYFLAWGLTEGTAAPEPDEVLAHRRIPFGDLLRDCLSGGVTDSLTVLMVHTAALKAQAGELPERPRALILGELARAFPAVSQG